jgi:phage gpG-like protein
LDDNRHSVEADAVNDSIKIEVLDMEPLFIALGEAVDADALLYEAAPDLFELYNELNKQNFNSQGGLTGGFEPLGDAYAARKRAAVGDKPIEQYKGRLYRSLTEKSGDTIYDIQPGSIIFGSTVEYAAAQNARNQLIPLDDQIAGRYGDALSKVAGDLARRLGLMGLEV